MQAPFCLLVKTRSKGQGIFVWLYETGATFKHAQKQALVMTGPTQENIWPALYRVT